MMIMRSIGGPALGLKKVVTRVGRLDLVLCFLLCFALGGAFESCGKLYGVWISFQFLKWIPRVRHISQASNDLDSEIGSADFATYTVHIPLHLTTSPPEFRCSGRLLRGGYNCVTRAQLKEKVIESETSHPQMTGAQGSYCAVEGCDAKVVTDERDAIASGESICPGCKQPYKEQQMDMTEYALANQQPLSLPSTAGMSKMERRLSLMKSKSPKSTALMESQTNDFDHNQWLFETRGSYGYGNAMWPKDTANGSDDGISGDPNVFQHKQWKPLTRTLNISAAILSPYR
ncbi:hypothetical protein GBA52_016465 [Prunus armeniaca]|nr:hypothetical protein GBA52_016465 [Prunus armeniaca]